MGEEVEAARARGGRPRVLDGRRLALFVAALETGATVVVAAKAAGFAANSFYHRRRQCPLFRASWDEAVEASRGTVLIAAANGRKLQKRRVRRTRLNDERRQRFLDHFAATCDATASAEAAGVCESTVYRLRARDPLFAEEWQAALEQGYARLEAEAVRLRIEGQKRIRFREDASGAGAAALAAQGFDQTMRLLQRYQRADGKVGARHRHLAPRCSIEEARARLEAAMRALGIRIAPLPGGDPLPGGAPALPAPDREG